MNSVLKPSDVDDNHNIVNFPTPKAVASPRAQPLAAAVVTELGDIEFEYNPAIQSTLDRMAVLMQVRDASLAAIRCLASEKLHGERMLNPEKPSETKGLNLYTLRQRKSVKLLGITLGLTLGLTYLIPYHTHDMYSLGNTLGYTLGNTEVTIMKVVDKDLAFYRSIVNGMTLAKR